MTGSGIFAVLGLSEAEATQRFGEIADTVWWRTGVRQRITEGNWQIETVGENAEVHRSEDVLLALHRSQRRPTAFSLLERVDELGVTALQDFRPDHAALALDSRSNAIHLSRDFMGSKPLYWGTADGRVAVASEPVAVQLLLGLKPSADEEMVAAYLSKKKRPIDRTFHNGVRSVPPDTVLTLGSPIIERTRAFSPLPKVSDDEACERVRSRLGQVIRARTEHAPLFACNASGGLDSGVIAAAAGGERSVYVTHLVDGLEDDETERARQLAAQHSARHEIVHIEPSCIIDRVVADIDCYGLVHPTAWLSGATIERGARVGAEVMLPGHLGDQWLTMAGGSFTQAARDGEFRSMPGYIEEISTYMDRAGTLRMLGSAVKSYGRGRLIGSYAQYCREQFRTDASVQLTISSLERFGARFGVDIELPFADRDFVETLLGCTAMQRNRPDRGKWILREAFRGMLPESYVEDPMKANFYSVPTMALAGQPFDGNAYGRIRQIFANEWVSRLDRFGTGQ